METKSNEEGNIGIKIEEGKRVGGFSMNAYPNSYPYAPRKTKENLDGKLCNQKRRGWGNDVQEIKDIH